MLKKKENIRIRNKAKYYNYNKYIDIVQIQMK